MQPIALNINIIYEVVKPGVKVGGRLVSAVKGKRTARQVSLGDENHRLINTMCEVSPVVS